MTAAVDTAELRKARGAFFTPAEVADFIAQWAVRDAADRLLEPSVGDAAFLTAAVRHLRALNPDGAAPTVHGVEIHAASVVVAAERVRAVGGTPDIANRDFFEVPPEATYDAVIGNPPFIRFQDFTGESRNRARRSALAAGVPLTQLASSWAYFTVHATSFLKHGGRLGFVLPAELLTVNYASPVRRFLFDNFSQVDLVLFDSQVFPEAEADVVLLLASGYGQGPTDSAMIRPTRDGSTLAALQPGERWTPLDPSGKWTTSLLDPAELETIDALVRSESFTPLQTWGETTLGAVTGNNKYFTMSPARAAENGLDDADLLPLSPPGSSHLRSLALTSADLDSLGHAGKSTRLFFPQEALTRAARKYIRVGHAAGVDSAYKCRVRRDWYRVPVVDPADLLLTCMNADTPRLTANLAHAYHLNSVHGVYLGAETSKIGAKALAIAALNSATLLHAELVGRSYGGGILKIEPREADNWLMPAPAVVHRHRDDLLDAQPEVARQLDQGNLAGAVAIVDEILLINALQTPRADVESLRHARNRLADRRTTRGRSGR